MRIVATEIRPDCRITVMSWNGKYLIKFERPSSEMVYKIPEDVLTPEEITALIRGELQHEGVSILVEMEQKLSAAIQKAL